MLLRDMALHLLFEFNLRLYGGCAMTDKLLIDRELLERVAGMTDRSCIRAMDELRAILAAPAAPAADATVRQTTDGGRNQSYEGLFDGETEEQRASRLAAHRTNGVL